MSDDRPCAEWCDRLDLSADELGPAEARELAEHLESCAACRREHEGALAIRAMLLAGDPATELRAARSRAMRAALLERCEAETHPPAPRRPWWPALLRWTALPVAAASALGVWALIHRPQAGPPGLTTTHPLVVDVRPPAPAGKGSLPGTTTNGAAHRKRPTPGEDTRTAAGRTHREPRSVARVETVRPHFRRAAPAPRLASRPPQHKSTPRMAREILVFEDSGDRGPAAEAPAPIRIAMGSGSSRPSQIALGIAARRP